VAYGLFECYRTNRFSQCSHHADEVKVVCSLARPTRERRGAAKESTSALCGQHIPLYAQKIEILPKIKILQMKLNFKIAFKAMIFSGLDESIWEMIKA
jgi:hypothetical protein